jgi:hypothetical protein
MVAMVIGPTLPVGAPNRVRLDRQGFITSGIRRDVADRESLSARLGPHDLGIRPVINLDRLKWGNFSDGTRNLVKEFGSATAIAWTLVLGSKLLKKARR